MSEPIKKKVKKKAANFGKPENLVVDILALKDIGLLIARANTVPAGEYDLVLEYKMGQTSIKDADGTQLPSLAVAVGGMGLKKSEKTGPHTIIVT